MSKIYVIGIGPGAYDQMTGKAIRAMNESDAIIGYTVYVDLVKEHFAGKEFLTTPMKKEVERCKMAFEEAMKGKTVSMICSGDAGVYDLLYPAVRRCDQGVCGGLADSSWAVDSSGDGSRADVMI